VKHREKVVSLLLPADQEAAEPVQPGVRALDDPSARAVAGDGTEIAGLVAAALDVERVAVLLDELPGVGVVVPLVAAEVLRRAPRRLGARRDDRIERAPDEALVMRVGAIDDDAEGNAGAIRKEGALRARFRPIRGVGARLFPPRGAPWSSRRRCSASPT